MAPFVSLVGQRPLAVPRHISRSVVKRNVLSLRRCRHRSRKFSLPSRRVVVGIGSVAGTLPFRMSKNDDDQQFTIDNAIKNMDNMSSELNKLMVETQMLLCDLILNFSHPALTDVSTEANEKKSTVDITHMKLFHERMLSEK